MEIFCSPKIQSKSWLYLMLSLCFISCAKKNPQQTSSVLPPPTVTSVSRVIIPTGGGQTIPLPQLMGDAQTLWSPLNAKEQRTSAAIFVQQEGRLSGAAARWFPHTESDTMHRYLYRLTHEARELTVQVLKRAEVHLPSILESLHSQKLPLELASLPFVESAFEPRAVSSAGAAGIWQLMPDTARRFGLIVNERVDERFDVCKSTRAATAYLAVLYSYFKDWPLVLAAYNCGEGTLKRALAQSGCATLADLTVYCRQASPGSQVLAEETLRFVPQFTAAFVVMSKSNEFGLTHQPLLALKERGITKTTAESEARKLSPSGSYAQEEQVQTSPRQSIRLP